MCQFVFLSENTYASARMWQPQHPLGSIEAPKPLINLAAGVKINGLSAARQPFSGCLEVKIIVDSKIEVRRNY